MSTHNTPYDIFIIGTGIAGCAAALFAADKGMSCAIAGETGELIYSSGLIDLMGVYPVHEKKKWDNPWEAISALRKDKTGHPYDYMEEESMKKALQVFTDHMKQSGLSYTNRQMQNSEILMPTGTVKSTWLVPESMEKSTRVIREKRKCIVLDIKGLQGFSSRQIATTLKYNWPEISYGSMTVPGFKDKSNLFAEQIARSLEPEHNRKAFADELKKVTRGFDTAGIPAILGISNPQAVLTDLENRTGLTLFEIPTMPPSISGVRLKEAFLKRLPEISIDAHFNNKVVSVDYSPEKHFLFDVESMLKPVRIQSKTAILATGRFIGQGLSSDSEKIRENLFDLHVVQPDSREEWHSSDFLNPSGHPVNLAGIETDSFFRPLDKHGRVVHENLFTAGTILAHQDWKRMKCGAGLSITTAYAAVNSAARWLGIQE